jgi:signal transduction histidine kinase
MAVEKLRNKVARDLHDDMGSTLSTINILSSMAKSRMHTNQVQASDYISKISDNSQRMMEAMDDIVWSIKPDNDTMQKITGRMREFATSVLEAKDIDLYFKVDEAVKDVKLNMEARRDFFLIFKEAVNNIAKYSKATSVNIHVSCNHNRLSLFIKDDGVGFYVDAADNGNGLGNMQKRTESLKGKLDLLSGPGEGTQINLQVPIQ